ncbi:MAG: hypothetical protein FJ272_03110, partial [Planctomycetes bacterium]|nr:hypothetical protein [Planctomycetota bacterium]
MKTSRIGVLLSVGVVFACAQATWGQAAGSQVTIGNAAGQIESLMIEAKALKLTGKGGGFFAYDATAKKDISFPDGTIKQSEGKTVFTCEKSGDLALAAEFSPKGPYVLVTGTLENRRRDERGIVLNYRLPISGPEAVFCNQLNGVVKVEDAEQEGNVFPIAALVAGDMGLAMAIPPTSPLIFGMAADRTGLTTRFYLGLSPETKRFPNRASFAFIIYPVDPAWGFRSALRKYYSFFPEYYEVRTKRYGYLLFNVFGREEQDMDTYALDRIGLGGHAAEDFVRDAKHGLATTFALNVGCKELTRLPKTPKSREEAVEIYKSLCGSVAEEWVQGGPEPTACEIIDSSACGLSTGRPVVSPRFTGWGGSSISFTTNPDPDLFEGKRRNMGEVTLANIEGKFKDHPRLNGILIDSLGANWPATLNYRKDHFPYADYPLTF